MSPSGLVYAGGRKGVEQVSFPGNVNFVSHDGDPEDIKNVELSDPAALPILRAAMEAVINVSGSEAVNLKLYHDTKKNIGDVLVDGIKVPGTGFDSEPVSLDKLTLSQS